ncbi:MAG TPA: hypothetical protein VG900_12475 [Hyphomicrobiaceae bacterium]|nr:hypothetical protein [Hyphomicrobiaceae bacterium]
MTPLFWALVPVFAGCVPLVAFAPAWHSGERWIFRQPAGPPPG